MVILRTEFLAVCGIIGLCLFHLFPTGEVLDGTCCTTVTMEVDVEQHLLLPETTDIQWHVIIYLIYSQSHIEILYLLVVCDNPYISKLFFFLNGQQQIFLVQMPIRL